MMQATVQRKPIQATVMRPRQVWASVTRREPPVSSEGVSGQLYDEVTGALLYDEITGAPLVW
jgi:uncharacterized protein YcfJ